MTTLPLQQVIAEGEDDALSDSLQRVRFSPASDHVVVPPSQPFTADEKRAMWYTSKELQRGHQMDVAIYTGHLANKSHKRQSMISYPWKPPPQDEEGPRRIRAPAAVDAATTWRGLEQYKSDTPRTERVQRVVRAVVAHHRELSSGGAPVWNEDLRRACQKLTRADRRRAEELGLQDATEVLGGMEVVLDLLTQKHTTRNGSPTRQFRKVTTLAKMGVSSALGALTLAIHT